MKRLLLLLLISLASPAFAQEDAGTRTGTEDFSNLPEEKRKEFATALQEASRLFQQKRIFETLAKLEEAEEIFADSPALLNLRGASYVEFRSFDKARAAFERALELAPDSASVKFNLAEVSFVSREWEDALEQFEAVLPELPEDGMAMRRLVEFKILLSKIKLGQIEEARKLADKYDYLDDSPYHYYAQAAIAFHDEDMIEAEQWLGRAARIFRHEEILAPWQDTLIEFGYIKNFYGGDISDGKAQATPGAPTP